MRGKGKTMDPMNLFAHEYAGKANNPVGGVLLLAVVVSCGLP